MKPASQPTIDRRPILVTGAHRTGTTWVGKMLAAGGETAYISEPLNVLHRPGVFSAPVRRWYTYICADNEDEYLTAFRQLLAYRYHLFAEAGSIRSRRDLLRMGRDWGTFAVGKALHRRSLLKDPFAIFSIPWFADRLNCRIVTTVRHPAGFASSLKRLGWNFNFADLLNQPLLMRDGLEPHRAEMQAALSAPGDVIGQAALLWKLIYSAVAGMAAHRSDLLIVKHEDLSLDPLEGYRSLYTALGLGWSQTAAQAILKSSSAENPAEVSRRAVHSVQLDSKANLHNWKRRLQPDEIERIRRLTESVTEQYYPGIGW
jgi:hypothetical protein